MSLSVALILIAVAFVAGLLVGRSSGRRAVPNPLAPGANDALEAAKRRSLGLQNDPAPAFGQAPAFPASVAGGAYRLVLLDRGGNIIKTIKLVREITHLGLAETKDLVEGAPAVVAQFATREEAERVAQRFQGVATVQIDG